MGSILGPMIFGISHISVLSESLSSFHELLEFPRKIHGSSCGYFQSLEALQLGCQELFFQLPRRGVRVYLTIHTCLHTYIHYLHACMHPYICMHTFIHPSIHPSIHTYIYGYVHVINCPVSLLSLSYPYRGLYPASQTSPSHS